MVKRLIILLMMWVQGGLAAPADSLNLATIWKILLQQNLTLQQQTAAIDAATAALNEARTRLWPTIQIGGSYQYLSDVPRLSLDTPLPGVQFPEIEAGAHHQYDLHLQVLQPLFTGFKLKRLVSIQRQQVAAQRHQAILVRQQLLYQSGNLYVAFQLARLQQQTVEASMQRLLVNIRRARSLFRHQQVTAFDTLRLANQYLRLKNQLVNVQRQQQQILAQLETLLNQPIQPDQIPLPDFDDEMQLPPETTYWQQAVTSHPRLQAVVLQKRIAQLTQQVARADGLPQLHAYASFHYGNPGANFFERRWNFYTRAGVQLQFDLWNWGRTHYRVQQAAAQLRRLSLEEDKMVQAIRTEIHTTYLQLEQVKDNHRYLQQLVRQEQLRFQLVQNRFQAGLATSLDLQEAESALTAAQLQLQQNRMTWLRLQLRMALATGTIGQNIEGNHEQ